MFRVDLLKSAFFFTFCVFGFIYFYFIFFSLSFFFFFGGGGGVEWEGGEGGNSFN